MTLSLDSYEEWNFFASGIFWIPYCILLFYLYWEHKSRCRYPQDIIMLFLAFGAVLRCTWFLIYPKYGKEVYALIINRCAILLQFSAVSLLMLMWARALKITYLADKAYRQNSNAPQSNKINTLNTLIIPEVDGKGRFITWHYLTQFVNIVVWCVILGTLGIETYEMYNINIILLSVLCLLEAIVTLFVGLKTINALNKELAPVYLNDSNQTDKHENRPYWCFLCQDDSNDFTYDACRCCCAYFNGFNELISLVYSLLCPSLSSCMGGNQTVFRGLQMQREVLKTLLSVTLVLFSLFLIRSFVFMYRPVIEDNIETLESGNSSTIFGDIFYPFFFYQIPEFFPTLAIAIGISPPNGILRIIAQFGLIGLVFKRNVSVNAYGLRQKSAESRRNKKSRDETSGRTISGFLSRSLGRFNSQNNKNPNTPEFEDNNYDGDDMMMSESDATFVRPSGLSFYRDSQAPRPSSKGGPKANNRLTLSRPTINSEKINTIEEHAEEHAREHSEENSGDISSVTNEYKISSNSNDDNSQKENNNSDRVSSSPSWMMTSQNSMSHGSSQNRRTTFSQKETAGEAIVSPLFIASEDGSDSKSSKRKSKRASTDQSSLSDGLNSGHHSSLFGIRADDADQWRRERQESQDLADLAEVLYRVHSFSSARTFSNSTHQSPITTLGLNEDNKMGEGNSGSVKWWQRPFSRNNSTNSNNNNQVTSNRPPLDPIEDVSASREVSAIDPISVNNAVKHDKSRIKWFSMGSKKESIIVEERNTGESKV